jgi:DNA-binding MarR family transcriptional regulator
MAAEQTETTTGRDCVAAATASAKLCYTVLCHEGPYTQSALAAETGLDRKTVQRAISLLVDCGVVRETVDPTDARQKCYRPVTDRC